MVTLSEMVLAIRALTVANLLVLGSLVAVWARTYWQFRARHTLGLLTFGGLLLVQNGFAVYLYTFSTPFTNWMGLAEPRAMSGMLGLTVLQLLALVFLARITLE